MYKRAMIIQKQFEKAGWGFPSPLKLNFLRNTDVPKGQSGMVQAGMITSPFSGLGGMINAEQGALGVQLPEYPVPDEALGEIVLKAADFVEKEIRRHGHSEFTELARMVNIFQVGWITDQVQKVRDTFFDLDGSGLSPPTHAITWDTDESVWEDFYCYYNKISNVEVFMKGTPNGHPMWDGLDIHG